MQIKDPIEEPKHADETSREEGTLFFFSPLSFKKSVDATVDK